HTFPFLRYAPHRDLHSFPTRRSSDLPFMGSYTVPPVNLISILWVLEAGLKGEFDGGENVGRLGQARASEIAQRQAHDVVDADDRSEEHTSELQSRENLVCRLLLEKKN